MVNADNDPRANIGPAAIAEEAINFRFVLAVWGHTYTDLYLRLTLPNQLSPGNLPGFAYRESSEYLIYTTAEDAEVIRQSQGYARLCQLISTEFIFIDDLIGTGNKYKIVTECQKRAMARGKWDDVAMVMVYADEVYADGTYEKIARIAATGKRAIFMPSGLVVHKEEFLSRLLGQYYSEAEGTITVGARELVKLGLETLHSHDSAYRWDSPKSDRNPSLLFWDVPGEGILIRNFTPFALMVRPRRSASRFSETFDGGDFLIRAFPDPSDFYMEEDSDNLIKFSVNSPAEDAYPLDPKGYSVYRVAKSAARGANKYNWLFFRQRFRMHYEDLSPKWEQVERSSDIVVDSILSLLRFHVILIVIDWKHTLRRIEWATRNSRPGSAGVRLIRRLQARFFRPLKSGR